MAQKAIYKPTKQPTVILNTHDGLCEIFLNNESVHVSYLDLEIIDDAIPLMTLEEFEKTLFAHIVQKPLSGILYSKDAGKFTPEPHQFKPLIKFLNSDNNRILIADEVGLGKTIEAGMIYQEISSREELPITMIVVPSSLTQKWQEEMRLRFGLEFDILDGRAFIHLIQDYSRYGHSKTWAKKVIVSYTTLRTKKVMESLKNNHFEVSFLIMDEAHTMRNSDTSTSDAGEFLTSIASNIIFLTATPVQNKLEDLFTILSMLDKDNFLDYEYFEKSIIPNRFIHLLIQKIRDNEALNSIRQFIEENEKILDIEFDLDVVLNNIKQIKIISSEEKISLIDALTKCDRLHFIVNRTKKKDVGKTIPRTAHSKTVLLSEVEKEYYTSVIEFVKYINPLSPPSFITIMPERMASSSMIASLQSFIQMRKTGKIFIKDIDDLEDYYEEDSFDIRDKALELLDIVIEKGQCIGKEDSKFTNFMTILKDLEAEKIQKIIVFSFFKKTLDYLEKKLITQGYKVGKIDGRMKSDERFHTIKAFKRGDFDILLSSEVGSEGLDMQFCNVVINYDLPWNPMRVEQRIGRIDRIGQKAEKLLIFNLCIQGSIEARIFERLYRKLNIFEASIGELEPILGNFSQTIDIPSLVFLNEEELNKKLHHDELALTRQEIEIKNNVLEFDKLLNFDNLETVLAQFLGTHKIEYLQEQVKKCLLDYLNTHEINANVVNGGIKLTSEKSQKLCDLLKPYLADKKTALSQSNSENSALRLLKREKGVHFAFEKNDKLDSDELNINYLGISHPIIAMITRSITMNKVYASIANFNSDDGYAIVYRMDLKAYKETSTLNVLLLSDLYEQRGHVDYFDFIIQCKSSEQKDSLVGFEKILGISKMLISQKVEEEKAKEQALHEKKINLKIDSINHYFDKQVAKTQKTKGTLFQKDVLRMRDAQIENYYEQKKQKIEELEAHKKVTGSFQILALLKLSSFKDA